MQLVATPPAAKLPTTGKPEQPTTVPYIVTTEQLPTTTPPQQFAALVLPATQAPLVAPPMRQPPGPTARVPQQLDPQAHPAAMAPPTLEQHQ